MSTEKINRTFQNNNNDISKLVMERIKEEHQWHFPEHQQKKQSGFFRLKLISSFLIISFLVLISMSFIVISPTSSNGSTYSSKQEVNTLVNSTGFAKSVASIDFTEINKGMVASIGEPAVYHSDSFNFFQIFIILLIMGVSTITLFINWLSREDSK